MCLIGSILDLLLACMHNFCIWMYVYLASNCIHLVIPKSVSMVSVASQAQGSNEVGGGAGGDPSQQQQQQTKSESVCNLSLLITLDHAR